MVPYTGFYLYAVLKDSNNFHCEQHYIAGDVKYIEGLLTLSYLVLREYSSLPLLVEASPGHYSQIFLGTEWIEYFFFFWCF